MSNKKQAIVQQKIGDWDAKQSFIKNVNSLNFCQARRNNIVALFEILGFEQVFGRKDILQAINLPPSPAGDLIHKMRESNIIEPVQGYGNGKYKFIKI